MRKRRLNSGYSGNVDNRRNIKGCTPVSKHYMERVLGRLDSLNYFLLDSFPGVSVAYSLRSLDGNFENPVVQVRRSSDNAESNFTAQEVSDGTLEAWCGGGDGYVSIWYDQSGNGKNAVQGTAASQPQIVSMGVLNKENGNPCLTFDGVNDHLQAASVTLPAHVSCMVVARSTRTGTNPKLWFEHSPNTNSSDGMYFSGTYWAVWAVRRSGSIHYGPIVDNTDWIGDDQAIASLLYNGHGYIYKNSQFVSNVTAAGTSRPNTNVTDTLNIGSRNGSSFFLTSNMQEMLIYPAMTPERMRLIETNINFHYNVYDASTLLGQYSGAAAAYSLRKVSYTNDDVYVVRVRRSTTNEERDFLSSEITDGTLETWCDSGDGFISVWYDQSGNNRDASQATAASQPKLVSSGVLVTENGLPAIEFDGTNDYLSHTGVLPVNLSMFSVHRLSSTASNNRMVWHNGAAANGIGLNVDVTGDNVSLYENSVADRIIGSASTDFRLMSVMRFEAQSKLLGAINGSAVNVTPGSAVSPTGSLLIGAYLGSINYHFIGTQSELIFYESDQSANRIGIEDNINEYYDIFDRTVLLLHMDGTNNSTFFYDSSRNGHPITVNGNTKISTNQSKFGGSSAYFDGNGDFLQIADNDAFEIGGGDFTFEAWIYLTGYSPSYNGYYTASIINKDTNFNARSYTLQINGTSSSWTTLSVTLFSNNTSPVGTQASYTFALNTWYHVAASRNGTSLRLYVNGVDIGGGTNSTVAQNTSATIEIGSESPYFASQGYGYYFPGYIDELKIVKGKALYTGNFTPPQAPFNDDNYTSLLLRMDGTNGSTNFVDSSSNAHTITANGNAQVSTAQSKFGGASAAFDGTGDYLSVPASATFDVGAGNYTIEFWVYWNAITNIAMLFGWNGGVTGSTFAYTYSDGRIGIGVNGFSEIASSASQATTGAWIHLAFVKQGSTTTIYKNGSSIASGTTSVWYANTGTDGFYIAGSDGIGDTNCYIDDLRITKGVARYTGNFVPPTAPHPDPVPEDPYFGYVSLLLPMDDGFVDKSFRRHIVTANGDAAISTAQSKFGGTSGAFDGSGDYLALGSSSAWAFGTGDLTIEFWFWVTSFAGGIYYMTQPGSSPDWYVFSDSSTSFRFGRHGANQYVGFTTALNTSEWYHVAIVRNGTTMSIFLNGVSQALTTAGGGVGTFDFSSTQNLNISNSTNSFNGYIDDLRITKNLARYTGNFIPSTAPHPIP